LEGLNEYALNGIEIYVESISHVVNRSKRAIAVDAREKMLTSILRIA
jgi:hypothetical protein